MSKLRWYPFICILALFSCAGRIKQIDPEWTEEMFFRQARLAMDEYRYKRALYYYGVFLVRYPENYQLAIVAEYERAFISYKMGNYAIASDLYNEIIRKYDESPYAMLYHPKFRRLCEIGLKNIEKKKFVNLRLFWRAREKAWAEQNGESITDTET
ncbi:hypothetical protein S1OALGB6SA_1249 [Olavius algarvensis spirochete endosymbiont]|uniref:hypothetical protein n=1 Tax=Olavius algarvensis spirochete endosymbiont TaxID=260710 RepID=UPI00052C1CD4|nr:hypothetical protein [Olavius algarvensis spirochete endosymbiont]KGM38788.1 hypothetical protein JY97_14620 [Alkalispirochaeta odontotermitis]VDB00174.1 hypothetical protein S1OALGB6SA_1249 [Olavius algarvensis spirochete endosymbiont]